MTATTLSVRNLAVRYGRRLVFHGVTFDLGAGQCLGVVGPNGAGKTTFFARWSAVSPRRRERSASAAWCRAMPLRGPASPTSPAR